MECFSTRTSSGVLVLPSGREGHVLTILQDSLDEEARKDKAERKMKSMRKKAKKLEEVRIRFALTENALSSNNRKIKERVEVITFDIVKVKPSKKSCSL